MARLLLRWPSSLSIQLRWRSRPAEAHCLRGRAGISSECNKSINNDRFEMTDVLTAVCRDDACDGDVAAPPVPWWSVTKTCLAACALVLVARGRLILDDPLPD